MVLQILKFFRLLLFILIVGVIVYIFTSHFVSHTTQQVKKEMIVACSKTGHSQTMDINDTGFHPKNISLKACDILVFHNTGTKYHQPAFGEHPNHLLYPGFNEKAMKIGTTNTVVLAAIGVYKIHDHIYDELEGEITIKNN